MSHPLAEIAPRIFRGYQVLIENALTPFPRFPTNPYFLTKGVQVPDATGFETLIDIDELRERLTRGGLAPEAVEKAIEAYEAGELLSLPIIIGEGDVLRAEIPDDLLRKVFPIPGLVTLGKGELLYLEYSINRHRFGKKSLTLKWPDDNDLEEEETPTDMVCEKHPEKAWPHDNCPGPGMPPRDPVPQNPEKRGTAPAEKSRDPRKDANREEDPWPEDKDK